MSALCGYVGWGDGMRCGTECPYYKKCGLLGWRDSGNCDKYDGQLVWAGDDCLGQKMEG